MCRSNWATGSTCQSSIFIFTLKFVFDRLSVPFVILTFLLCGTIGAFTTRYLHREQGFVRFYIAYAMFMLGMIFATLAGTIEVLFFGWELVGLSSALLIAFFHERRSPVKNGLMAWCVYRIADAAFLIAAVLMHHLTGAGDFDVLMGQGAWPDGVAAITQTQALMCRVVVDRRCSGEIGVGPVFRLVASRDGRANVFECNFLWGTVGSPGRLSAAPNQPDSGAVDLAFGNSCCPWFNDRDLRHVGGTRSIRHQDGSCVRFVDSGRNHRGRNWSRAAVHRPDSHSWATRRCEHCNCCERRLCCTITTCLKTRWMVTCPKTKARLADWFPTRSSVGFTGSPSNGATWMKR